MRRRFGWGKRERRRARDEHAHLGHGHHAERHARVCRAGERVPVVLLRLTTGVTPVMVPLAWALRPQTTPMRVAVAAVVRRLVVLLRRLRVQMSVASQPHRLGSHRVPHQTLVQVVAVGSGFQVLITPVALVEEGSLFLDTLIPVHSDG